MRHKKKPYISARLSLNGSPNGQIIEPKVEDLRKLYVLHKSIYKDENNVYQLDSQYLKAVS
jgi:hypothetical protein